MDASENSTVATVIEFIAAQPGPAWLVGGYVRDLLLDRPTHDLDIIVPAGGITLARSIAKTFGGAWFALDDERDVGRAILPFAEGGTLTVDVARLRAPTLVDDLALRDCTVNAIAMEIGPETGAPIRFDPFDGQQDLARGLMRAVTEGAFVDDPLRTLRAVRQSVALGFRIEGATFNLIRRDAPLLAHVSAERVRDELFRIVAVPGAWRHVQLLRDLDLLPSALPESDSLIGVMQSPPHYQDVFDHTRSVLAHLEGLCAYLWPDAGYVRFSDAPDRGGEKMIFAGEEQWAAAEAALAPTAGKLAAHLDQSLAADHTRRDLLFWAALAHDWGKASTASVDEDGRIRFLGHHQVGADMAARRAETLRMASNEVDYIETLVGEHMRPTHLASGPLPSRRAVYRFYRATGDAGPGCLLLSLADYLAISAATSDPQRDASRMQVTNRLLAAYFDAHAALVNPMPLLNGRQIMADFGLRPGPKIGALLAGLREAQAAGEVETAPQARAFLADAVAQGSKDA